MLAQRAFSQHEALSLSRVETSASGYRLTPRSI